MSFKKKILLSVSIFFSLIVVSIIGVTLSGKSASVPNTLKEVATQDDRFLIIKSDNNQALNFTYQPDAVATSSDSVATKVYEFEFGNNGTDAMGVDLVTKLFNGDNTSNFNFTVSYLTSPVALTSFERASETYQIPNIAAGETEYIYIILSVIDQTKATTFSTSLEWLYGKPVTIVYSIPDMTEQDGEIDYTVTKTLIASTSVLPSVSDVTIKGGYGVKGWYLDSGRTKAVTSTTQATNYLCLYAKLDLSGEFNPANNISWFALMGNWGTPNDYSDDWCVSRWQTGTGYSVSTMLSDMEKTTNDTGGDEAWAEDYFYLQVIQGSSSIKNISSTGQLVIPSRYTFSNGYTIPIRKLESLDQISATDTGKKPIFSGQQKIKSIVISEGVETLGYGCFNNCDSLTYIELPSTINFVNNYVFQNCDNLEEVKFRETSDSVSEVTFKSAAFNKAPKLARVTLPTKLTKIPVRTFNMCYNLREITVPAAVTSIDSYAFVECVNLRTVNFAENSQLALIDAHAFDQCSFLTNTGHYSGTTLNSNAGFDLTGLTKLTTVGTMAFYKCGISSLTLGKSITNYSSGHNFQECANLKDVTFEDDSTLTTIPQYMFHKCSALQSVNNIPETVKAIDAWVFNNCSSLTSITLPSGITALGGQAFSHCSSLPTINVPAGVEAIEQNTFSYCTSLSTIKFDGAPEMIDRFAFSGCAKLKNTLDSAGSLEDGIVIPEGVQFIGHGAFYNASGPEKISLPGTLVKEYVGSADGATNRGIDYYAFQNCTNLTEVVWSEPTIAKENALDTIGSSVFSGCAKLTTCNLPSNITNLAGGAFSGCGFTAITADSFAYNGVVIGQQAYQNCKNLSSIDFSKIKEIGHGAFLNCLSLTSITIPNTVTAIGPYAFQSCENMTAATITAQITTLPSSMFMHCHKLQTVKLSDNITKISDRVFNSCFSLNSLTSLDGGVTKITSVGSYSFSHCYALSSITFTNTLQSIEDRVFIYSGITSLTIPSTVTEIGDWAFAYCDSLTNIDLSQTNSNLFDITGQTEDQAARLGNRGSVFAYCRALTRVYIPNNIAVAGGNMFSHCENLKIAEFAQDSILQTVSGGMFRNTAIQTISLPNSVKNIDTWAFAGCSALVSIEMPEVTKISDQVFSGCSSLTSTITNGVLDNGFVTSNKITHIGYGSFHNCTSLTTVVIGENVRVLAGHTFLGATSLANVTFMDSTNTAWKLYNSEVGEQGTTNTANITINGDGTLTETANSTTKTVNVAKALTTAGSDYYAIKYPGSSYVYQYWEKQ